MLIYNNENVCWFERIESQTTFDKITFQNITYQHGSVMCKEALNKTELEINRNVLSISNTHAPVCIIWLIC